MNVLSLIGMKIDQTQGFLEDGTRVPLSVISMKQNVVSQVKTQDHEGYSALQLGFGISKRVNKPTDGHIKKEGLAEKPRFFREIRADEAADAVAGTKILPSEVFEPGDLIDVVGTSKGKGYAGVVKRHGFHGGPRTHGQSDRERAPGSIGQTTTPGRVYRGKRMSGRMGNARVTIKNLMVLEIQGENLLVKGLIPGAKGSIVVVKKVGKNKKFMPLWSEKQEATPVETAEESVQSVEQTVETPEERVETAKESVKVAEETVQATSEEKVKEVKAGAGSLETISEEVSEPSDANVMEDKENAGK
jgi:large subunit ribosomal protein L3